MYLMNTTAWIKMYNKHTETDPFYFFVFCYKYIDKPMNRQLDRKIYIYEGDTHIYYRV